MSFQSLKVAAYSLVLYLCISGCAIAQQVLWQFTNTMPHSEFGAFPTVGDDGTIYVTTLGPLLTNGFRLYAVSPSGVKRWEYVTDEAIITMSMIGEGGAIYVGTVGGRLFAIKPSGVLYWIFDTKGALGYRMALGEDNTIYCQASYGAPDGTNGSKLFAIAANGTKKWESTVPEGFGSGVLAVNIDGSILWATYNNLRVTNPDGTPYWNFPSTGSEPAIGADGTIYITATRPGAPRASIYALHPDGTLLWTQIATGTLAIGPDNTIYDFGGVAAFNVAGFRLWTTPARTVGSGVVSSDGTIYVFSEDTISTNVGLLALNSSGARLWHLPLGTEGFNGPALLPDGTMYFTSQSNLYSLRVQCGPANSPWPMLGHDLKQTRRAGNGQPNPSCFELNPIRFATSRGFQFTVIAQPGETYRIESSTDLLAWNLWTNFLCSNTVTHFTDSSARSVRQRFYRGLRVE